jgi:2-polyprenyl-6-methoxyphenol hydroxylase-like FAD-dependent oxidoreductase
MRIAVIGGGPAGLYFALLMKKHDGDHDIVVIEQNAFDATYGFGVVFSEKALSFLEADDPETCRLLGTRMEVWDDLVMVHRDRPIPIDGNGFSAIARIDLLTLLQDACRSAGVAIHFDTPVRHMAEFADFDLVVGADGAASLVRETYREHFQPTTEMLSNRFVWYGTRCPFDTLSLTFRTSNEGAFVAHHYRYTPEMSTFIVECDAASWERAGFEAMDGTASRRYCEAVFAADLGGHELIDNNSIWRNFPIIANRNWSHGNVVLIGDALRTVHFSVGSGTRLALEDSLALFAAFRDRGDDVALALARFEETRRPIVEKLLTAAGNSAEWYEHFHEIMERDPHDLVYSYMTRTGRVDDVQLRKIAPRFMTEYDSHNDARTGGRG